MHCVVIAIVFILIPFTYGAYLPTLFWDTSNPILEKQFWHDVVQVKIYDFITFVCPNDIIKIRGSERINTDGRFQNLYVKEVPADIKNFDGACDTSENSTAIFILNCDNPKELKYQNIQINLNQAHPDLPKFKYGQDYMFFATSDGREQSLTNNTSKNCTLVFRIHFSKKEVQSPSCPLFDRKNVCKSNKPPPTEQPHTEQPKQNECKDIMPQELNTKRTTGNKVSVSWQHPSNITCNITYYTVCYRENLTEPCREVFAPEKQRNVTLCELAADQKYIVQVRAHTAKGPGNYSNKKTFETDWKKVPECHDVSTTSTTTASTTTPSTSTTTPSTTTQSTTTDGNDTGTKGRTTLSSTQLGNSAGKGSDNKSCDRFTYGFLAGFATLLIPIIVAAFIYCLLCRLQKRKQRKTNGVCQYNGQDQSTTISNVGSAEPLPKKSPVSNYNNIGFESETSERDSPA